MLSRDWNWYRDERNALEETTDVDQRRVDLYFLGLFVGMR